MAFVEPILGGLAAFALGAVWYTFLFGKAWQAETGVTDEQAQQNIALTHGLALIMMILMSFTVNFIVNQHSVEEQTFIHGGFHGIMTGLFFVSPAIAINYLYQKKIIKTIFN